jgi:hypothetical protein
MRFKSLLLIGNSIFVRLRARRDLPGVKCCEDIAKRIATDVPVIFWIRFDAALFVLSFGIRLSLLEVGFARLKSSTK